jgi:hypothetical protein
VTKIRGASVIKLFTGAINFVWLKATVFKTVSRFHPSLIIMRKYLSLPLEQSLIGGFIRLPSSLTIITNLNYNRKTFILQANSE